MIFWIGLLISTIFLPIYFLLKLLSLKKHEKRFVFFITSRWARFTLFTAGIKLVVSGRENLPVQHAGIVVISNHQGNFDIPVFMACLPFSTGFIAKKELMKMPFLSAWMKAIDCLPIDRSNPRDSRERLISRIKRTDKNPIFLFPEGTRSRSTSMGPFRTGTLKLLFHNRIHVLPVTINGSFNCYEKNNNIGGGFVSVAYHPLIDTSRYELSDFEKFNDDLQRIIASPLGKPV